MMWPTLTNVRYECLARTLLSRKLWIHLSISLVLNWIIGPLLMLALAWATMPDLPTYRTGVIMVGIARCIAMVMIWNGLAGGDTEYCAILVVVNSMLQIALYSPYAVLFVNIGGAQQGQEVHLQYGTVAISVLIVGAPFFLSFIISFGTRRAITVSRHSPPCGRRYTTNGPPHIPEFLPSHLPPLFLSHFPPWFTIHYSCPFRIPRSSYRPQHRQCSKSRCSAHIILCAHVDRCSGIAMDICKEGSSPEVFQGGQEGRNREYIQLRNCSRTSFHGSKQ